MRGKQGEEVERMYRVGIGQDSHRFANPPVGGNRPLVLGGVVVSKTGGVLGKSDADVILHSLCNSLSSAIGGDSLSTWADKMLKKGVLNSQEYVRAIFKKVKGEKYKVRNVSISVEAKKPKITLKKVSLMKKNIAGFLEIKTEQVGITFTSGEGLTSFGKGLGIQAICVVLISHA